MPPRAVRGCRMTALPEPRTVRADGIAISVRDSGGSGPALLLLHGLGGASESWAFQFGALGARYRVIAWDMPGYGLLRRPRLSDPVRVRVRGCPRRRARRPRRGRSARGRAVRGRADRGGVRRKISRMHAFLHVLPGASRSWGAAARGTRAAAPGPARRLSFGRRGRTSRSGAGGACSGRTPRTRSPIS